MSVDEAIHRLINGLYDIFREFKPASSDLNPAQAARTLRQVVPRQKISPVQFDIVDLKITLLHREAGTANPDSDIASAAKDELLTRGEKIIGELSRSNCDRRLLENFQDLQRQLCRERDIVRLGISNLSCRVMSNAFEAELPTAVKSMLHSQTLGISMYVAQFPEWARFCENAAASEFEESSIRSIQSSAALLAAELESRPELADPEVPRIVRFISQLIDDPGQGGRRAAFAALRTIENFVIRVYQFGADFIDATANKTSSALSTTTARVIVASLLSVAVAAATGLEPAAIGAGGAAWLERATEIVVQQLQRL